MDAGASALAGGVEAGDVRLAPGVRSHAAHRVVRGRGDRDRLARDVEAVVGAEAVDLREARRDEPRIEVRDVEQDVVRVRRQHALADGAGDDVARGQLGAVVVSGHEALAVGVAEEAALAAHRLRDEERLDAGQVERRGVELHELHVHDLGARAVGDRDAVAGGDFCVRGCQVHLAGAACRQDERPAVVGGAFAGSGVEGADGPHP